MKKFFLIFIPIILILTYIFYQNNLLPHPKYTNDDFGIQTYKSINDQDHDGIDDQSDIVQNVRKYIETKPLYKSKYYQGGYPTDHYGVCSDVVAFGLLNAGYDLQILVDQDIRENPQSYQVEHPDKNIDFRRADGSYGAVDGKHDDIYMSRGIVLKVSQLMDLPVEIRQSIKPPPGNVILSEASM